MTQLIPYASLASVPWKNGGGSTTEIAISPSNSTFLDFDWRISLATISESGPFSVFPGVDRTLTVVQGAGVILDIDGARRITLGEDEPTIEFAGESMIHATPVEGPTIDFNVMTRRAYCQHRFGRRRLDGASTFAPRGDMAILFLVDGEGMSVSSDDERIGLVRFDTVVFDTDQTWTLEAGPATVFIVDIFLS